VFGSSLTATKIITGALVSCIIGGAGAWYLTKYTTKYGIGLLSAWGMLSLGFILVPLSGLNAKDHQYYILAIYVGLAVLGFLSAAKFSEHIEVFVTAFIGSYSFVRGISFYAGGFINELEISEESI